MQTLKKVIDIGQRRCTVCISPSKAAGLGEKSFAAGPAVMIISAFVREAVPKAVAVAMA